MFEKELASARNIYDIMAISYVHIITDESFNLNVPCKDGDTYKFKNIFNKYLEDKVSTPCDALKKLKIELLQLHKFEAFSSKDFYYILLEIDSCEIYKYANSSIMYGVFKNYKGLNYYYRDRIRIFPILHDNYREHLNSIYVKDYKNNYLRDRKKYDTLSLSSVLCNYIIIETPHNYDITIHELIEYDDFICQLSEKNGLKLAIFPMTYTEIHEILNISYTENKTFRVDAMKPEMENTLKERCINFIKSIDTDTDIVIFPEMLMTNCIISSIQDNLDGNIKLMFMGSIWEDGNNTCRVFYGNQDELQEVFNYNKKIPFTLKYKKSEFEEVIKRCKNDEQLSILKKLLKNHDFTHPISFYENLNVDTKIEVIDINKLGRILTYICKDIDDDSYMKYAKIMNPDFIILPACSPSGDLINAATVLSERYHCTTIMCNTCSALCKNFDSLNKNIATKKNIGFIVTPSKTGTSRSHQKIFYTFNEECINCQQRCAGRLFHIDLDDLQIIDDTVSLEIKEIRREKNEYL